MKDVKHIKLFVSCPSDIVEELDSIRLIVERVNKTSGKQNGYIIELLNWKTDVYTQIGVDVQDVINKQSDDYYDILIGLLWLRLGTPTKRDKSGTVEEINRALNNKQKEQLIYFKTSSPLDITTIDTEQLSKVNLFKKELSEKGVLFHEFNSIKNFETLFEIQLPNLIFDQLLNTEKTEEINEPVTEDNKDEQYPHIASLISQVENTDQNDLELDIFASFEKSESHVTLLSTSLNSLGASMREWTKNMENRTGEMNKINNIRDERLRLAKQRTIINLVANELHDFNSRIQNELEIYSHNFRQLGTSYSNLILIAKKFNSNDSESLRNSVLLIRDNAENSMENLANLIRALMNWPPLNTKFNNAKRETELSLNKLLKDTMEGVVLLNEALKTKFPVIAVP